MTRSAIRSLSEDRLRRCVTAGRIWMAALSAFATLQLPRNATANPSDEDRRTFVERSLGVEVVVPLGWTMSKQSGYPSLLFRAVPPTGAKTSVSFSVGRLDGRKSLRGFVAENKHGMSKMGLRVFSVRASRAGGRKGWQLAAETKDASTQVRQFYQLHRGVVLIWTLRCEAKDLKKGQKQLNRVLNALVLNS